MKKNIFLGGTCNNSTWRDRLIPQLTNNFFNPVTDDWNEAFQAKEDEAKANSEFCLYVLTPASDSPYSIAEVVDDSNKRPGKVVFHFLEKDEVGGNELTFNAHQIKAMKKIGKLVEANGGYWAQTMEDLVAKLNS